MKKSYPEQISEQLIQQLEQGTAPFQKPWEPGELAMPYNPTTQAEYKGSNSFWLTMQGRIDPRWMTYKQAQGVDAQVRKGEKGTQIQYWKFNDNVPRQDSSGKAIKDASGQSVADTVKLSRPRVFSASVFNAEQIEGLPELKATLDPAWQRHERAEALIVASGASLHNDQVDGAYYKPISDTIHLPEKVQFQSADGYYRVALHELGHWTGHASRLNRDLTGAYGSESYAKEELRAEISSLMVGTKLGVGHDIGQHAAYVKSWVKALKDDPTEILRASRDADKIREFVLSYDQELTPEKTVIAQKGNDVLQKAEKYAERFDHESDKSRFMKGVRNRLEKAVGNSAEVPTIQNTPTSTKAIEREPEIER